MSNFFKRTKRASEEIEHDNQYKALTWQDIAKIKELMDSMPIPERQYPVFKNLGQPSTIGELKNLLASYQDDTPFGFRNQPMQALYEIRYGDHIYVSFGHILEGL